MKKSIACIWMVLLLIAAGCAAPVSAPAPTPTAAPTPAPVGMARVFGRDVEIGCSAAEDSWFGQGVKAQAEELHIPVSWVKDGETAGDGMIAYYAEAAVSTQIPAVYVTANGADAPAVPDGCYGIVYDAEAEADAALQAMYAYPSHESPIRILGMFDQPSGRACAAYQAMIAEGKLYDKGIFAASDGFVPPQAWLSQTLPGVTPGLLDTVFTENPALAMAGYEALRQAQRGDAVEICTAGLTPALVQAMIEDHFLMGTAVGENQYGAGKLAVRMLACLLAGETVDATYTLAPLRVYSDDVIALYREGTEDVNAIMEAMDMETEQICRADFMEELEEYYGA